MKACPILVARVHMQSSLIPSCVGISGHPSGSRQGNPQYTWGPISGKVVGWPEHCSTQQEKTETQQTFFFIVFFFFDF